MIQDMKIRPENPGDIEAISRITELAFRTVPHSQQTEHFIVDALRRAGALTVSLVAEVDGEVVGHIAFSRVEMSDGSKGWYILGPISVSPDLQGHGIGSALVNAGLEILRSLGAEGCVLVGDPAFYGRFGFKSRPTCTMEGVPQEYVQALTLGTHEATGNITIHPAFWVQG